LRTRITKQQFISPKEAWTEDRFFRRGRGDPDKVRPENHKNWGRKRRIGGLSWTKRSLVGRLDSSRKGILYADRKSSVTPWPIGVLNP